MRVLAAVCFLKNVGMRLRLFLRRLTVSAPRMAVRSALPWPLRWALLAIVAGFCAAIALWAFEFSKNIAGLDRSGHDQLLQLRQENAALQAEMSVLKDSHMKAQSAVNTVDTLLTTEKVAQQKLASINQALEAENRRLKDDLGFFERLIPVSNAPGLAIRGLQAHSLTSGDIQWQVLVIQATKNPAEFKGQLDLTFTGSQSGVPWSAKPPAGTLALQFKQYGRLQGVYQPPRQVLVTGLTVKVFDGSSIQAVESVKL